MNYPSPEILTIPKSVNGPVFSYVPENKGRVEMKKTGSIKIGTDWPDWVKMESSLRAPQFGSGVMQLSPAAWQSLQLTPAEKALIDLHETKKARQSSFNLKTIIGCVAFFATALFIIFAVKSIIKKFR